MASDAEVFQSFDFAEIARGLRQIETSAAPTADEPEKYCSACENGGWECYGLGYGDPHFRECPVCQNPFSLPSP